MEEIYWADIKTNLSEVYFDNAEDETRFCNWLNDVLNTQDIINNCIVVDNPVANVSQLMLMVEGFESNHILSVRIDFESELDYDTLLKDQELISYIENEFIPSYIEQFNAQCITSFPMTRSGDFKWMKFDGDCFYTKVYYSESQKTYMRVDVQPASLYLINDFQLFT